MLSFVYCKDRPGWNNMFTLILSHPACCLRASWSISFKIQTKTNFLMLWKRVFCFENRLSGVKKKQTVRCFTKYTPKNQIELNRIEAICIVVVVLLIFTLSFLIILFFILFHLIFLPLTFSGMHVCTMHTGSYPHASSGNVLFLSSII